MSRNPNYQINAVDQQVSAAEDGGLASSTDDGQRGGGRVGRSGSCKQVNDFRVPR